LDFDVLDRLEALITKVNQRMQATSLPLISQDETAELTELVVIQPSSFCNIDCNYCYVPDRSNRSVISPDILEDILAKVFCSRRVADGFRLLWHNGEPLSRGIPFYENALAIIRNDPPTG
jgi:sulfatase maturation enzyme AslB (radical SAM superfamily)